MTIPNDWRVWVALAVATVLIAGALVYRRYAVSLVWNKKKVVLTPSAKTDSQVSVGPGLVISGSKIGPITGIRNGKLVPSSSVDVLSGGTVSDSEIGEITGVGAGPAPKPLKEPARSKGNPRGS